MRSISKFAPTREELRPGCVKYTVRTLRDSRIIAVQASSGEVGAEPNVYAFVELNHDVYATEDIPFFIIHGGVELPQEATTFLTCMRIGEHIFFIYTT